MKKKNNFDLKKIGTFFTLHNLWHKNFNSLESNEINMMCAAILDSYDIKPTVDNDNIITKCHICGGVNFWRFKSKSNNWTCQECHPMCKASTIETETLFLQRSWHYPAKNEEGEENA